jgi:hypothetical protein
MYQKRRQEVGECWVGILFIMKEKSSDYSVELDRLCNNSTNESSQNDGYFKVEVINQEFKVKVIDGNLKGQLTGSR